MASPTMTELRGALDVLNTIIDQTNDYNKNRMEEYGLTEDFCGYVGTMGEEEIESLTLTQVNSYLDQFGIDSDNILQIFAKGDNSVPTLDKWKEFFTELRKATRDMDESLTIREELKQACEEVCTAQKEFIQSAEYRDAYREKIEKLRAIAEAEQDPYKKKEYLRRLDAIQKSGDLTFLLDRLDDPVINKKNPNKELDRLIETFFDKSRGQYLMQRYLTNAKKLGLNPQYHVNLYDIEEKFLPESLYPLNNFFLFVVMSFIAYVNTEDEVEHLHAITILSMMGNLMMGELSTDETNTLLGIVRTIENRILIRDNVMERFRQNNTTWKEHPIRKEHDEQRAEMKYRLDLITEIKTLLNGFGANLTDGTTLTAKNASAVLRSMDTKQIEGIRDDIKAEAERHCANSEGGENDDTENELNEGTDTDDTSNDEEPDSGDTGDDGLLRDSGGQSTTEPLSDTDIGTIGGDGVDYGEASE